ADMHLSDGRTPDGTRLLSSAIARAMRERQVDHPAAIGARAGHGLGWMLSKRPGLVEHGGDTIGVAGPLAMGARHGRALAWRRSTRPGVCEQGGHTSGLAALLLMVPEKGIAVAMLTNGGAAGPL